MSRLRTALLLVPGLLLMLSGLTGCGDATPPGVDPAQVDATAMPHEQDCRNLTRADLQESSNASRTVPCTDAHNAETYATGALPATFKDADATDPAVRTWTGERCAAQLRTHLGTEQSTVMRSMLRWVWFGPSEKAWSEGARWYRCDVIAGGQGGSALLDLPVSTKHLLRGKPNDRWMVCARGASVNGRKVPCTAPHTWRAVATVKLGEADDDYPGDARVKTTSDSYCKQQVRAVMGYPDAYDYGYTWFGRTEWESGNRLSVCWSLTKE